MRALYDLEERFGKSLDRLAVITHGDEQEREYSQLSHDMFRTFFEVARIAHERSGATPEEWEDYKEKRLRYEE